jgi:amino acid adenylation domain-containing protein
MGDAQGSLRQRLRGLLRQSRRPSAEQIRRPAGDVVVPAPLVQQNFWCLDQFAPGQGLANVNRAWQIEGAFQPEACHSALQRLTSKYDCLRCSLFEQGDELQMIVKEHQEPDFTLVDLRQNETELAARMAAESQRPFADGVGPLLRLRAYRLADQRWLLHLVYHHAILDGWSLTQFCQELGQLYAQDAEADLVPQRPAYDFADHAKAAGQVGKTPTARSASQSGLQLPYDYAPPAVPCYQCKSTPVTINAASRAAVESLAAELSLSPGAVLLAALRLALFRISGQRDFCLANTMMNRNAPGLHSMLGAFVQSLPICNALPRGISFAQLCQGEQVSLTEALIGAEDRNQDQPPAEVPCNVLLNYRGFATGTLALAGCEVSPYAQASSASPFALVLNLENTATGYRGELLWQAARFEAGTCGRIVAQILASLAAGLKAPNAAIDEDAAEIAAAGSCSALPGPLFSPSFSQPPAATPDGPVPAVGQLLEQAFARWPERRSLRMTGDDPAAQPWRYRDLDLASAAWANALLQAPGGPGDLVALALPRGPEFVAALIGILRSGRAFLPLSPQDPPERLKRILHSAQPSHVIAEAGLAQALGVVPLLPLPPEADGAAMAVPFVRREPEDLAYVMFTSGSTGVPKGVAIPHRALANHLAGTCAVFAPQPGDRLLSVSSTTFDSILHEVLFPLVSGGELVMVPEALRRDPWHLCDSLKRSAPHHFFATPSLWRMLLEAGLPSLPHLQALIGGETMSPALAARILPQVGRLYNVYGPTEATVFTTWKQVLPAACEGADRRPVGSDLGQPFPGYSVAIMDENGQTTWPGAMGEIWISGPGIATGYYGDAERSAQSFVSTGLASGEDVQGRRWYRSGDLGRLQLEPGSGGQQLAYLGRLDDQVKISGQRVEPAEIENLIQTSGLASQAAVVAAGEAGRRVLVAFYVTQNGSADMDAGRAGDASAALRHHLQANLPSTWVPGLLLPCASLPLNGSGKIDRAGLLRQAQEALKGQGQSPSLGPDLAPVVIQAWEQVLGRMPTGDRQDFFASGGTSLLMIRLLALIRARTACHLPVAEAFGDPTPAGLTALLDAAAPLDLHEALICARQGGAADPLVMLPGLVDTGPNLTDLLAHGPPDRSVYQLQRSATLVSDAKVSFADHTRYFAKVLHQGFAADGLHLAGFSYGGAEAFETARQLVALKAPPAGLTVIDHGLRYYRPQPINPTWTAASIAAETRRRAHGLRVLNANMSLVRAERPGLVSLAMIALGWEDFVSGEVAVHVLPGGHADMLHAQAAQTMQVISGQVQPEFLVASLPGAADRRRVVRLIAKRKYKAAHDVICGVSREHAHHPWSVLMADRLGRQLGQDPDGLLSDWIETVPEAVPPGVPELAWHAGRAEVQLRLGAREEALHTLQSARACVAAAVNVAGRGDARTAAPSGAIIRNLEVCYGDVLQQLGRFEAASAVLETAADQYGYTPRIWRLLGLSLAKQQHYAKALPLLQRAAVAPKVNEEVQTWLARAVQAVEG